MSEIKDNDNIIEIILVGSARLSLKESSFKNNNIIDFPISFSAGDLSEINNYIIKLPKEIYSKNINFEYKDKIVELNNLVDEGYKVRVWTSHYDTDDYLLLLFICSYLKNKVDNIIVLYSDEYKRECYSPSTMTGEELNKLSTYEHIILKEDINKLAEEWNKIIKENSDLRIIKDEKIYSISYDYFNNEIINILNQKGSTSIIDIICELNTKYHIDDTILRFLINRLIDSKKITIVEENERYIRSIIKAVD